ncbi:hypothetical protein Tco_0002796 [Tanacetum coccineum]
MILFTLSLIRLCAETQEGVMGLNIMECLTVISERWSEHYISSESDEECDKSGSDEGDEWSLLGTQKVCGKVTGCAVLVYRKFRLRDIVEVEQCEVLETGEVKGGMTTRVIVSELRSTIVKSVTRHETHLVDTDTESRPLEDLRETEIPQPLLVVPSPVLSSDDLYLTVRQAHTPSIVGTESELGEAPSEIEEFLPLVSRAPLTDEEFKASKLLNTRITSSHFTAPSDSTTPLSPDHPLAQTSPAQTRVSYYNSTIRIAVRTQPTLSSGMSARIAEATTLSPSSFHKRYRSSYETPSPSSSPTLPIRKRYRSTSKLVEDTEDESLDSDTEIPVVDTTADEPLGLGYGALRHRELALGEGSVPSTFEIRQSSRSMSEQQRVEETPAPRPPVRVTWVDPVDGIVYIEILIDVPPVHVPIQTPPSPEWSSGSLPVSPSSLAVLTPVASPATTPAATIAVDEDEFLELYTRSRAVLALESRAGHADAQRAEMWQARYDDHRLIHDLLVQHTAMQREVQEMRDRVATLEQERSRREQ